MRVTVSLIWKTITSPFTPAVWIRPMKMAISHRNSEDMAKGIIVEKPLVNKCHNYRQYCEAWINYRILRLTLIQNQAENANKLPYITSDKEIQFEHLWNYFNCFEGVLMDSKNSFAA